MRHHAETSSAMSAGIHDPSAFALARHAATVDENGPGRVAAGRDRVAERVAERLYGSVRGEVEVVIAIVVAFRIAAVQFCTGL